MKEDKFTAKFLIADRGEGYDTIMHADQIVIVPIETLSAERKKTLESGDYGKLLIEKFLKPWGYTLNGQVEWSGEESGDLGLLVVKDNVVSTRIGKVTYD